MSTPPLTARCPCATTTWSTRHHPTTTSACHCISCATTPHENGQYAVFARIPASAVTIPNAADTLKETSSDTAIRACCVKCGALILMKFHRLPEDMSLNVKWVDGGLDVAVECRIFVPRDEWELWDGELWEGFDADFEREVALKGGEGSGDLGLDACS